MRCPHCGSPATVRGSYWECGWCGDCGMLQRAPVQKPAQITLKFTLDYHVDLPEAWNNLKKALRRLRPGNTSLPRLLGKVLLYHISLGIHRAGAMPDEKKMEELWSFLYTTDGLNLGKSAEETMHNAKQGVLFHAEASLSETDCGTFWTELLSTCTEEDYYNHANPDGLDDLFFELSSAYAYFGGKKDEELKQAQDCRNAMEEAYAAHCQNKVLLHPDAERAKQLLSQGAFPDYEDICREILLVEYPEEVPHESAKEFDRCSWQGILCDKFEENMELGIKMWRTLLDAAEPALWTDPGTASKMLPDWEWLTIPRKELLVPFLDALRDEHFAKQVFQSADPCGSVQDDILCACFDYDRWDVGENCLALAMANAHLEKRWIEKFRRYYPPKEKKRLVYIPNRPANDSPPADGPVFHYCAVYIPEFHRTYTYLTGGLPLKVDDWVEIPFGKENDVRRARVHSVTDCTRPMAPWPPEKTKTVLRIVDAPEPN